MVHRNQWWKDENCKCASRVINGAEHLPEPNWKEKKLLGHRLQEGYRLMCQLWLTHDLEIEQDNVPLTPLPSQSAAAD